MKGYSLVELVIALSLGTLLMLGAASVLLASERAFVRASEVSDEVRSLSRVASTLERLSEDAQIMTRTDRNLVLLRVRARVSIIDVSDDRTRVRVGPGALRSGRYWLAERAIELNADARDTWVQLESPVDVRHGQHFELERREEVTVHFDKVLQISQKRDDGEQHSEMKLDAFTIVEREGALVYVIESGESRLRVFGAKL